MTILIKDGLLYYQNEFTNRDLFIDDQGRVIVADNIDIEVDTEINASGSIVIPGLINPLSSSNDLIQTGNDALAGGYATIGVISDDFSSDLELSKFSLKAKANIYKNLDKIDAKNTFAFVGEKVTTQILDDILKEDAMFIYTGKDFSLFEDTNCQVHISDCNLNDLKQIKILKRKNVNISCDISISKLFNEDYQEYLFYLNNNTIDMFNNNCNLDFKVVFGLLYAKLVKYNYITLEELINLLSYNVADIFRIEGGEITSNEPCQITIFDIHTSNRITSGTFKNNYVNAKCLYTIIDGEIVYK